VNLYPLALRLDGRRVLVVGGGAVATRRMPALLAAGARVEVVSPELTPALRALADQRRITWTPRRFQPGDVAGAWLVQVAVDDPAGGAARPPAGQRGRRGSAGLLRPGRRPGRRDRVDAGGHPARRDHRRGHRQREPAARDRRARPGGRGAGGRADR
jgi:hypothetical protein